VEVKSFENETLEMAESSEVGSEFGEGVEGEPPTEVITEGEVAHVG
jgi:hypothetical protein